MKRKMDSLDRSRVGGMWFCTWTNRTGEVLWADYESVRRRYFMRFRRRWGDRAFVVWKKEAHKSGWPHLHGLLFWVGELPSMSEFREWNDVAWAESVGKSVEDVKLHGCRVEEMRSWNGVTWYAAKYLGKIENSEWCEGRMWGVENRKLMPISLKVEILPASVGVKMRRALRKLQERKRRRWMVWATDGFTGEKGWYRIRQRRWGDTPIFDQPDEVAADYSSQGLKVKLSRVNVMRRQKVKIWNEVTEVSWGVDRTYMEPAGEELESVCCSWHSMASDELVRLRNFLVEDFLAGGGIMPFEVVPNVGASPCRQVLTGSSPAG